MATRVNSFNAEINGAYAMHNSDVYREVSNSFTTIEDRISDLEQNPDFNREVLEIRETLTQLKHASGLCVTIARKHFGTLNRADLLQGRFAIKIKNLENSVDQAQVKRLGEASHALFVKTMEAKKLLNLQEYPFLKDKWVELLKSVDDFKEKVRSDDVNDISIKVSCIDLQLQGVYNLLQDPALFSLESIVQLIPMLEKRPALQEEIEANKAKTNELITQLCPELQDRIDFLVYQFSPEPKGGESWGKIHRFDRFEVLEQAFGLALWEHLKERMPEDYATRQGIESLPEAVFNQFYALAQIEKKTLKKEGNPALARFLNRVGHNPVDNKKAFISANIMNKPLMLAKAFWKMAGRETFQAILNQNALQLPSVGFSIEPVAHVKKSELEKLRDDLAVICQIKRAEDEVKSLYIQGMLDRLTLEERYAIEGNIFQLSSDPIKYLDPLFGKNHAYDHPQTLLAAVEQLIATVSKRIL